MLKLVYVTKIRREYKKLRVVFNLPNAASTNSSVEGRSKRSSQSFSQFFI